MSFANATRVTELGGFRGAYARGGRHTRAHWRQHFRCDVSNVLGRTVWISSQDYILYIGHSYQPRTTHYHSSPLHAAKTSPHLHAILLGGTASSGRTGERRLSHMPAGSSYLTNTIARRISATRQCIKMDDTSRSPRCTAHALPFSWNVDKTTATPRRYRFSRMSSRSAEELLNGTQDIATAHAWARIRRAGAGTTGVVQFLTSSSFECLRGKTSTYRLHFHIPTNHQTPPYLSLCSPSFMLWDSISYTFALAMCVHAPLILDS